MASIFSKIADKMLADKAQGTRKPGADLPPIDAANDMSLDEQKVVNYVRDKVDECRHSGSRIAYESIWLTNIAYLLGFSGVTYDSVQRQFKNVDPSSKFIRRQRLRVNKILPTIQNRLARLCQSPPQYDVRPNSNSTEDKDAARLGLQIIESVFDKQRFDEKRQELFMTTQQYGYGFVQTCWDDQLGEPMIDPDTGEFNGYEGDIRLDVLNPLEVFTDPLAKRMDDVSWWIKARVRKLSYFRERYQRGNAVKEEDSWILSSQYEQRINSLTTTGITGSSTQSQAKNSAIEVIYYEKRSKDYPQGRKIVTASGILLADDELPIGEFDLTKFDDVVIAGKFQSESIITHLRPIQDQYNLLINKRADWVRKMLAGKYAVPRGAGLQQEAMDSDSGEVLHYNVVPNAPNGGQPIPMQIPNIPAYAYNEEKSLDMQFDFVSGLSEISRGQLPFAGIPAEGMQMLMEADQTRIGVMTTRNEIGFSKIGCHILKYANNYYKLPRILKLAGDGLEYSVKEFTGGDVKDNYDVIVLPGSTQPSSKSLKRQEIINAWQSGLLGMPQDPKVIQKVLKMTEFGDSQEIWKTRALTDAQIKKTIDKIEQGSFDITPGKDLQEFDDHVTFFQELNDYRMTDKFQELDPQKQELFMYIMNWHLNAEVARQNPGLPQQQQLAEHMVKALHSMPGQPPMAQPAQAQPGYPPAQGSLPPPGMAQGT